MMHGSINMARWHGAAPLPPIGTVSDRSWPSWSSWRQAGPTYKLPKPSAYFPAWWSPK